MWLYDAGIINFCHNLGIPELPLEGNAKSDTFKVYMKDTGLFMAIEIKITKRRDAIPRCETRNKTFFNKRWNGWKYRELSSLHGNVFVIICNISLPQV